MFTPIGHILPETARKNGLVSHATRPRAFSSFEAAARSLLSEEARSGVKALRRTDDGTLTVACRSVRIVSELRERERELLEALKTTGTARFRFLLSPWR